MWAGVEGPAAASPRKAQRGPGSLATVPESGGLRGGQQGGDSRVGETGFPKAQERGRAWQGTPHVCGKPERGGWKRPDRRAHLPREASRRHTGSQWGPRAAVPRARPREGTGPTGYKLPLPFCSGKHEEIQGVTGTLLW